MAMQCLREPLAFQPYHRDVWGLGFAQLPSLPVLHPLPTGAVLGVPPGRTVDVRWEIMGLICNMKCSGWAWGKPCNVKASEALRELAGGALVSVIVFDYSRQVGQAPFCNAIGTPELDLGLKNGLSDFSRSIKLLFFCSSLMVRRDYAFLVSLLEAIAHSSIK